MPVDQKPWYRHFWPWFIIALPTVVVVACFITLYIAIRHGDSLVVDEYYKEGLAINRRLGQDRMADQLDLRVDVVFDLEAGEVAADFSGETMAQRQVSLRLLHPFDADRDQVLTLERVAPGRYRSDLVQRPAHRYYLRLSGGAGSEGSSPAWRLTGEMDFSRERRIRLRPHG